MTAIHAATSRLDTEIENGIRAFDIGRDLRPVAELIAEAFASELDTRGSAALREMRVMSHIGGILKLLNRTTGEFNDVFSGFVWVEDGRVIGNVTVQRADQYGNRWQIANVAVAPAQRGRGIAHALMQTALRHIDSARGRWAVLQVYARNGAARHLYEKMGFEYLGGLAELKLPRISAELIAQSSATPIPDFRPFPSSHWQELFELANQQHNVQAQWWRPLRRADFQVNFEQQAAEWFARAVGRQRILRRCIQVDRRFEAAVILRTQRWQGNHNLRMWIRPEHFGRYEDALLGWMVQTLQEYPRLPVELELSTHHHAGHEAAKKYGFEVEKTLLTMRRKVKE